MSTAPSPKVVLDSPASLRGAGVDARRRQPDRQRRRQALAAAGLGGTPTPIPTGSATWIDINHAISPDGKSLAFTAGPIWKVPAAGGEPSASRRPRKLCPRLVARWQVARLLVRPGNGLDLFTIAPDGGPSAGSLPALVPTSPPIFARRPLDLLSSLTAPAAETSGEYPPQVRGPGDAKAERITSDDREDAAPHPSPDGKWLCLFVLPRSHQLQRHGP